MDGTENQKDTSQTTGDTSGGEKGTSEKTPETFTKEQREKAVSDALATAGRTAKDFEKREAAIKAEADRMAQLQKDKDQAELDAAGDDREVKSAIQERHKHRETKSELARAKQELEDERGKGRQRDEDTAKSTKEQNAREIATRLNVDASKLLKFTDGSSEAMEELAKELPKLGEATPPLKSDSGRTIGGGEMPESAKGKIKAGWDDLHKS